MRALILDPLVDVLDVEFAGATLDERGIPSGEDAEREARLLAHADRQPVTNEERPEFLVVVAEIDLPVREDAIHIEQNHLNLRRAAFDLVVAGGQDDPFL